MGSSVTSVNFGFLGVHDPLLVRLAAQAEGYVFSDPETAIFKLRTWVETLAKQIAVTARLPDVATLDLLGLLRLLKRRAIAELDGSSQIPLDSEVIGPTRQHRPVAEPGARRFLG